MTYEQYDQGLDGLGAFALLAQYGAEGLFASLGLDLDPRLYLFALPDDVEPSETCIRSAEGVPTLELNMETLRSRADEHAAENSDPFNIGNAVTSTEAREMIQGEVEGRAARAALEEALSKMPDSDRRSRHVSFAFRRGDSLVGVILDLDREQFLRADRFSAPGARGEPVSLLGSAIAELLHDGATHLARHRPYGSDAGTWSQELLRRAAASLMDEAGWGGASYQLFDALTAVAALNYEGKGSSGELLLLPVGSDGLDEGLALGQPVPISDHPSFRKLVAASSATQRLACDTETVHTICVPDSVDARGKVRFRPGAQWEFTVEGRPLFRLQGGIVRLPHEPLARGQLRTRMTEVFGEAGHAAFDAVWPLVERVQEATKGAVFVVSAKAAEEAERLSESAFTIEPSQLADRAVDVLTRMDGAILVDLEGRIHATGVILDGLQTTGGERSRGARFNATRRYMEQHRDDPAIAIVISEDGPVDLH